MSIFSDYAQHYELLYGEKDYEGECSYVQQLFSAYCTNIDSMLELGCGMAGHAIPFARIGYKMVCVDRSPIMLEGGKEKAKTLDAEHRDRLMFMQGDIRTIQLDQSFDVVISLFHVMSYLTSNTDLESTIRNVASHLRIGGVFIFDFWYGPAVLLQRPHVRIRNIKNEKYEVCRIADPALNVNTNTVDVNYRMFVEERSLGRITCVRETHQMRYFFVPELQLLMQHFQLKILHIYEWMSTGPPSEDTWSACVVAQRQV